jgi:hypothetical protein
VPAFIERTVVLLTDGMEIARDVQIMILGVYHFANPGLDAVKI